MLVEGTPTLQLRLLMTYSGISFGWFVCQMSTVHTARILDEADSLFYLQYTPLNIYNASSTIYQS